MWGLFIAALLLGVFISLLPGYILLRATGFSRADSLMISYPVSVVVFSLSGIALDAANLSGLIWLISFSFGASSVISVIIVAIRKLLQRHIKDTPPLKRAQNKSEKTAWAEIAIYITFSIVVMMTMFFGVLGSIDTVVMFGDNAYHLAVIKSMLEAGSFSTLSVSDYPLNLPPNETPVDASAKYYPAAYHIMTCLMAVLPASSVAIAENASNFLLTTLVYPLSTLFLLRSIFPDNKKIIFAGAFTINACVAFPLRSMVIHQLYPTIASFACIPAALALLYLSISSKQRQHLVKNLISFVFVAAGIALLHPSGIFVLAISALALVCGFFYPNLLASKIQNKKIRYPILTSLILATVLVFALIWMALLNAPPMLSTTTFYWDWTIGPLEAFISTILLGLRLMAPNYTLSLLMMIGFIYCIKRKHLRWLCINAILFLILFFLNAIGDYDLKRIATGFWYTDPERSSALIAIAIIPLTASGLYCLMRFITQKILNLKFVQKNSSEKKTKSICAFITVILFLVLNYAPNYFVIPLSGFEKSTGFPSTRGMVKLWTDLDKDFLYDQKEKDFVKKALEYTGNDDVVINMPYDGSLYSYPLSDMNVYYKSPIAFDDKEKSKLIRTMLDEIASNNDVKGAVDSVGAKYVLKLHQDPKSNDDRNWWDPDEWIGLDSITDETPGFETVLSDGDMRLYRIL